VREPIWLSIDEVIETNKDVVTETGEPHHLRTYSGLASALDRPKNRFFYEGDGIVSLAMTLLFAIAENHPFEQGNKRTGLISASQFLWRNGFQISFPDNKLLGRKIRAVIRKERTREDCVNEILPYVMAIE
jgi:death on curing protein